MSAVLAFVRRHALIGALALAFVAVGCPCTRSAVNASPELRWWLFSRYGVPRVCPEMLKRGVPLDGHAVGSAGPNNIGRFFPATCDVRIDEAAHAVAIRVSGSGYVMLPVTRRVGFTVAMSAWYAPDFRLEEDATYVWGQFQRFEQPPDVRLVGVENPLVNLASQTSLGVLGTVIANGLVASQVGRGFTVVRQEDGDAFAIGHLDPPARPPRALAGGEKGHVVLESGVSRVLPQSREFLGPFENASAGTALFLDARVAGAAAQYTVVERSVGEAWRRLYETAQPLAPPPGASFAQGILPARVAFSVPPGTYYVVIENGATPSMLPFGDAFSDVTYKVEVGSR